MVLWIGVSVLAGLGFAGLGGLFSTKLEKDELSMLDPGDPFREFRVLPENGFQGIIRLPWAVAYMIAHLVLWAVDVAIELVSLLSILVGHVALFAAIVVAAVAALIGPLAGDLGICWAEVAYMGSFGVAYVVAFWGGQRSNIIILQ